MSDSLFDLQSPPVGGDSAQQEMAIRNEQVVRIREQFDRLGIDDQKQRQELIESAAFRPVASLRDLTAVEARRIITRLMERSSKPSTLRSGGSSWDNREEDTWIDKL